MADERTNGCRRLLPALGFAIVIKIIGKKELLPYFVAGYFILNCLE